MAGYISYSACIFDGVSRPAPDGDYQSRVTNHSVYQWMESNPHIEGGVSRRLENNFPGPFNRKLSDDKKSVYAAISS